MIKHLEHRPSQSALENEFAGIDGQGVYLPKSLRGLSGQDLRTCLRGVQKSWQRTAFGRGIYSTDAVTTKACSHKEFLEFLVLIWLQRFNFVLSQHLTPVFLRVKRSQNFCLGSVDFAKFEMESDFGSPEFDCSFNELTFDRPELRVIKDGYVQFVNHLMALELNSKQIVRECTNGLQLVRDVPKSQDPASNAYNVRSKSGLGVLKNSRSIELPVKLMSLAETIDFFSDYLLHGLKGATKDNLRFKGLLFNLNYLLEVVLRCSLRSLYTDYSVQTDIFKNNEINEIQVHRLGKIVRYRSMRPDCQGVFSKFKAEVPKDLRKEFDNSIYLIDAKHKVLVKEQKVENTKRDDLYQIISYARTHKNEMRLKAFYGLVCLDEMSQLIPHGAETSGRYIGVGDKSNALVNRIIYDENEFDIFQIPINFAQLLFDVGSMISDREIDHVFMVFGVDLLRAIRDTKLIMESAA